MSPRYEIEPTSYGLRLSVSGFVSADEVAGMDRDLERAVRRLDDGFGLVMDMSASHAFSNEAAARVKGQLDLCREHGMARGAIVLQSALVALQARRILAELGLLPRVRFLDSSAEGDWEAAAVGWVRDGTEPPEEPAQGSG